MGSSPSEVDTYLAELVAYVSHTYESEINTRLLIGDVVLYTTDPSDYDATTDTATRLSDMRAYWRENYASVDRALAVHLARIDDFGGGIASLDQLCDDSYGYSVSGVYGDAPSDASQISWDAEVLAHELGHNFSSPHTHCYNGLEGNSNPVDGCYNGEADNGAGPAMNHYQGSNHLQGKSRRSEWHHHELLPPANWRLNQHRTHFWFRHQLRRRPWTRPHEDGTPYCANRGRLE